MDEHQMKDAALRLALEGFENIRHHFDTDEYAYEVAIKSITAIKQALEQPEPEPFAWYVNFGNEDEPNYFSKTKPDEPKALVRPLYTSTPKREWQGLTDEEVFDIWLNEMPAPDKVFYQKLCRSVEAELKVKNGFPQTEKNT